MLGEIYIEYGFIRAIIAGDIMMFWGEFVGAWRRGGAFYQRYNLYAYPAGAYFCSCKSRQNTLGAMPQDPLAAKLRLDTNWTFQQMLKSRFVRRRRYALKVPAAHFIWT